MKETNLQLLIEYQPQDHGALCVSCAPQQERTASAAKEGGGRRQK